MTPSVDQCLPATTVAHATNVDDLRALARRALQRMYRSDAGVFAFRIGRRGGWDMLEGVSRRYTAIAMIGLAAERRDTASLIFGGEDIRDVCRRLVCDLSPTDNMGDVALTLWAARALEVDEAVRALDRLRTFRPLHGNPPTVELAWVLTALAAESGCGASDDDLAEAVAERLMASFVPASGLFPHWPDAAGTSRLRRHVTCFADLVYPIQALAHYHLRTGDERASAMATRCAEQICALQGADGQWWWHYDVRTGRVVEGYPVYAVHQDAMAPMALFDLQRACGVDHTASIRRGMAWLRHAPEIDGSLIDPAADLIWRKVARREPGKLSRSAQALVSRVHPALRVPGLGALLRPGRIDYECRPYHLGWLLYAWSPERMAS